jgi:hypothetical protein
MRDDDGDNPRQHPPEHRDFKEQEELFFDHIDGMYSLCKDSKGNPVHLVAWAEVEVFDPADNSWGQPNVYHPHADDKW